MTHVDKKESSNKKYHYTVEVTVDTIVLFLWLETSYQGAFQENGLVVTDAQVAVGYVTSHYISPKELERNITYKYYLH